MTQINGDLKGILSSQKAVRDMAKQLSKNATVGLYRKPLKKALEPFHERITTTTPVESGALRDSVKSVVRKPNKRDMRQEDVSQSTVMIGKVGWERRTGDQVTYKQLLAVEFGSRYKMATPVIRPAFNALQQQSRSIFAKELGTNVEKAAKKIARKQKKVK